MKEVIKQFVVDEDKVKSEFDAIKFFMDWRKKNGYNEALKIKRVEHKKVFVVYYSVG